MKKKIDILGRKVPVLAVMMVLLVIGTASAALIVNYATLTGEVTVTNPITVTGDGDAGNEIMFTDDAGDFTIDNDGDAANVNLVTTLYLGLPLPDDMPLDKTIADYLVTDTEGITITYETLTSGPLEVLGVAGQVLPDQVMPVENGENIVTVTFDADPGLVVGIYTIQVEVNPIVVVP